MSELVAHLCCRLLVSYKIGGTYFHSPLVLFGYMSSGSVSLILDRGWRASTSCDMHRSSCGVLVRKAPSPFLRKLSLV